MNNETKVLLNSLKELKIFKGPRKEFFDLFLNNLSKLFKSDFSCALDLQNSNESYLYYSNEVCKENKEFLINKSKELSKRSVKTGFAVEQLREKWLIKRRLLLISFNLSSYDITFNFLVQKESEDTLKDISKQFKELEDIYFEYEKNSTKKLNSGTTIKEAPLLQTLEILSILHQERSFKLASIKLLNELSHRFNLHSCSFGYVTNNKVKTIAISNTEEFDKRSVRISLLEELFKESFLQQKDILYPNDDEIFITDAHKEYAKEQKSSEIISMPLVIQNETIAIMLFEKKVDPFKDEEFLSLRFILNQLVFQIDTLYRNNLPLFEKVKKFGENLLSWFFTLKHSLRKTIIITSFIVLLILLFTNTTYKVEATSILTTNNTYIISAPYDAKIDEIYITQGEEVKRNQSLARLDTEELFLKQLETKAEISKFFAQSQRYRAQNDLSKMNISLSKMEQSKIQLKLNKYYLKKSKIITPIDGVVTQVDKVKLLGSHVNKGNKLFTISKASEIYLNINVKEEYIDEIKKNQKGNLILLSRPSKKISFIVQSIIPIGVVDKNGNNSFLVKAKFTSKQELWWKPGMSGLSKISIEDKSLFWILTHKIFDFLRYYFWI